ncbi:MAG TPA: DUF4872 domain-containing protein [Phototrophicaceae bacterium]|nr:DUF4872 domain-containing protein [Phototrophicaceae bacterium]
MTVLTDYHHFDGLTWNIGYLCNMLAYQGVIAPHTGKPFTEAMLSGINGGVCAGYFVFEYEGYEPHLHFLTRYPFNDHLPDMVFERLGIVHHVQQTTNPQKATANVLNALAKGKPAAVWGDIISLYEGAAAPNDYWFITPFLVYGHDLSGGVVNVADRARVPITTTTENLDRARARVKKTKFRMMTVDSLNTDRLPEAILGGIKSCIGLYYGEGAPGAPQNFGFNAFIKWADALKDTRGAKSWAKQFAPGSRMYAGLVSSYKYLEVWFTGGCGARGVYADFLSEAATVLDNPGLAEASAKFRFSADLWQQLTQSLLPDNVAPFKTTRELLNQHYELFLNQGNAARDKRQQLQQQLDTLKAEVSADFPLSESEVAGMRSDLRDHVMAIHDAEQDAIVVLKTAIGLTI